MQKRVFIMRHGQTEWNVTARLNSTTDISLSEKGRRDIAAIRPVFSGVTIDRMFASPLRRAHDTARLLALDPPIELDARLAEVNFGPFEGKTPQELSTGPLAQTFELWRREPDPVIPPGAEDFYDAAARAQAFFATLNELDGTTLIVSHGVFLRVLLCQCVLGMPPTLYRRIVVDNGRISEITWEGNLPRLSKLNATRM